MHQERIIVTFQGQKQSRICKKFLYQEICGQLTKQHWAKRHHILPEVLHQGIDWAALGKAMAREPHGKHRWLTKHCAGHNGCGRYLLRRKHQTHDRCPRCDSPDENPTHVLQCMALPAKTLWTEAITDLHYWLIDQRTQPQLRQALLDRLTAWRAKDPQRPVTGPRRLKEAIAKQDILGWENFIMGRVSPALTQFQQGHCGPKNMQRTGPAW